MGVRAAGLGAVVALAFATLTACGGTDDGASYDFGVAQMKIAAQQVGADLFVCETTVARAHPPIAHYSVSSAKKGCVAEERALDPDSGH